MNKPELEKEVKKLKQKVKEKDKEIKFLYSQQKELRKLAEQAGSELAKTKHELIRAFDKLKKHEERK